MNPLPLGDIYPLAPAQQGMLLLTLAEADPAAQVDQSCTTLLGPLDPSALERAWQWAVDRHPMLRTAFAWQDLAQPLQAVLPRAHLPFQFHDWQDVACAQQEPRLERFLASDRRVGFMLSQPPLMRLTVIRMDEATYRLIWSRHRVLLDGWSTARLLLEVDAAYAALSRGQTPVADAPGVYKDYVSWLARQNWTVAEEFWGAALRGVDGPTPLGRPSAAVAVGASVPFEKARRRLPETTLAALKSLARERRLTLNTFVQGAWALLLSRYSQRSEVLFGTTVAGRPAEVPGVDSMLGLFINTLPMRVSVPPMAALGSWLAGLQAQHLELRRFEYCSAGQVHGWSQVPGGSPLYESIVVFQNTPGMPARAHAAGTGDAFDVPGTLGLRTDYPLTMHAFVDAGLVLTMVYDASRFVASDVQRVLSHLTSLLEQIAAAPEQRLGQLLEMIAEAETPCVRSVPHRYPSGPPTAPRNDLEEAVAGIWRELLGVPEIGVNDNFFAMRGHSLLAMRLLSRVRDAFEVDMPLSRLFATPTVAGLSQAIEEAIIAQIEALAEDEARLLVGEPVLPTDPV